MSTNEELLKMCDSLIRQENYSTFSVATALRERLIKERDQAEALEQLGKVFKGDIEAIRWMIQLAIDYHHNSEAEADAMGYVECLPHHEGKRKALESLLAAAPQGVNMSTPRTDALEADFEPDTRLEDTLVMCRDLEELLQSAEAKLAECVEIKKLALSNYEHREKECDDLAEQLAVMVKVLTPFTEMRTDAPGFVRKFTYAVVQASEAITGLPERAQRLQALLEVLDRVSSLEKIIRAVRAYQGDSDG